MVICQGEVLVSGSIYMQGAICQRSRQLCQEISAVKMSGVPVCWEERSGKATAQLSCPCIYGNEVFHRSTPQKPSCAVYLTICPAQNAQGTDGDNTRLILNTSVKMEFSLFTKVS